MATAEAVLPRAHSRLRRIDLRVAVGLLLMLVAVVGGAGLGQSPGFTLSPKGPQER